jgi:hypothetical protein
LISWQAIVTREGGSDVFEERYQLRRTRAGWRVTAMRYWPVELRLEERRVVFDRSYFDDLDEDVERLRAAGDERELLWRLQGGYRFREANELARQLSGSPDADAWVWSMRSTSSLCIGDAEDAELSHQQERGLQDEESSEPP